MLALSGGTVLRIVSRGEQSNSGSVPMDNRLCLHSSATHSLQYRHCLRSAFVSTSYIFVPPPTFNQHQSTTSTSALPLLPLYHSNLSNQPFQPTHTSPCVNSTSRSTRTASTPPPSAQRFVLRRRLSMVVVQIIVIRLFARFMIFVGGVRRRIRKRGRSRRRLLRRRNNTSRSWLCMSIG